MASEKYFHILKIKAQQSKDGGTFLTSSSSSSTLFMTELVLARMSKRDWLRKQSQETDLRPKAATATLRRKIKILARILVLAVTPHF